MKQFSRSLKNIARILVAVLVSILLALWVSNFIASKDSLFQLNLTAFSFTKVVSDSRSSTLYLDAYDVRLRRYAGDGEEESLNTFLCFSGTFKPALGTKLHYSIVSGRPSILAVVAEGANALGTLKSSDDTINIQDPPYLQIEMTPRYPETIPLRFARQDGFEKSGTCAPGTAEMKYYTILDGNLEVALQSRLSQWDTGTRPNFLGGTVDVYGRSTESIGPFSLGKFTIGPFSFKNLGFRQRLFPILNWPLTIPPGSSLALTASNSSHASVSGYAVLKPGEDSYEMVVASFAEKLEIRQPAGLGSMGPKEIVTIAPTERLIKDPLVLAITSIGLTLLSLPVFGFLWPAREQDNKISHHPPISRYTISKAKVAKRRISRPKRNLRRRR